MTKIYVGNLPFSADESQVRELFSQHGTVESVSIINDRETGRPRGFGFVEMARADAARAIQNLNGKDMGGRPLKVNEAQDKPSGGRSGGGGGGGGYRGGGGGGGGGYGGGGGGGGGGRGGPPPPPPPPPPPCQSMPGPREFPPSSVES